MLHPYLEAEAADYARRAFAQYPHEELAYHSIAHTENVVRHAIEIAGHSGVTPEEKQILEVAAWLHDLGHLTGPPEGHEERSVAEMERFLTQQGIEDAGFETAVRDAILATKFPHNPPANIVEQIICDADTYHFGTDDFKQSNKLVKKELQQRGLKKQTKNWSAATLAMLQQHCYFTPYANKMLTEGKQKHINRYLKKVDNPLPVNPPPVAEPSAGAIPFFSHNANDGGGKKTKSGDDKLMTRGIQTMLRLTSQNHLELSNLADGKSNILISVNAIIISVVLSVLVRKLETEPWLTIPTLIFLMVALTTIVLAILATRPKVTEGNFTREQIMEKRTNLLFFGNFYKSTLAEYEWGMDRVMTDKEYLYRSLVTDIYYLGVVLGRKYKLLRWAYNIFMYGIILSVLAFVIAEAFHDPGQGVNVTNGTSAPF